MMNDFDRAHGKKDLKDSKFDPACEKMAEAIKAKVEKTAEPDLKKSLEPQPKPEAPKAPEPPAKGSDDSKKTEEPKKPELPIEERVRQADEACRKGYEDVQQRADLAVYVSKHFDPQSDQYKYAMKGLAEGMAQEKKSLIEFRELAQKQADPELNKELEHRWKEFYKQQVHILNKLHDTTLMTDIDNTRSA